MDNFNTIERFALVTMSGEEDERPKGGNGGPSTLRKMLKSKHPSLSMKDASELILKAREQHGGSLSGMKMGKILRYIEVLLKEKKCQYDHDQNDKKEKKDKSDSDRTTEIQETCNKNTGNDKTEKEINDQDDDTYAKTCKFCFKMFLHRKSCRKHMSQIHGYSQSSGSMIPKVSNQKMQKSVVKNVAGNKCSICDKIFLHSYTLNRHMQNHEEESNVFKCKFCDKSFSRKDILTRHKQIIHRSFQIDFTAAGQKTTEQKTLRCKMCSMDFGDKKESFFAHLTAKVCQRKINKIKLDEDHCFECNLCTKKYLDRDSLVKHIRWKHSNKREEYGCNQCTSKFQHMSSLVRHMKKFHGNS